MRRDELGDLAAFLTVARAASFTRAAASLGTSQSALSHTIRRLEERLGIRLLTRTTRSVSVTQAGERLMATLSPALDEIAQGLASLTDLRDRPSGSVRISTSEHAANTILWPVLAELLPDYPDIEVELSIDNGLVDIVAGRFDAGVRLGDTVAKDMIAARVGPDLRLAAVGSPEYLKKRGVPSHPQDLSSHACINLRQQSAGGLYPWEFEKDGREVRVKVEGQLTFNNSAFAIKAACADLGLALVMEDLVLPLIIEGKLVRVLDDWCAPFRGFHIYYPSRRQPSQAFAIVLEALKRRS